jgi:hypothetical protein
VKNVVETGASSTSVSSQIDATGTSGSVKSSERGVFLHRVQILLVDCKLRSRGVETGARVQRLFRRGIIVSNYSSRCFRVLYHGALMCRNQD